MTTKLGKLVQEGDLRKVEELLKKGIDLEARDNDLTPLHQAIMRNSMERTEMVDLLLKAGASPNATLSFRLMNSGGAVSIDSDEESKTSKAASPLHLAVDLGLPGIVELLVQAKANVNAQNTYGYAPLHLAVDRDLRDGSTTMVDLLLGAGANPNIQSREVRTPTALLRAAASGQAAVVRSLARAHAQVDARTSWNGTALMVAAANGNIEIVRALLDAGADVNARSGNRCTALLFAVDNAGDAALVEVLLAAGADPSLRSNAGESPLSKARQKGRTEAETLLRAAGAVL